MVALIDLVRYSNAVLGVDEFRDYTPNGLQVEGAKDIELLVTGVTANLALLEVAVEMGAQAVMVHHGYFWKSEAASVVGMKRRRLKTLLENDISLLAYHLPLDAHEIWGNNAQLAKRNGWVVHGRFGTGKTPLGFYGELPRRIELQQFCQDVGRKLGRAVQLIDGGVSSEVKRLAWCSGAAQSYIEEAANLGVDLFLSGEISEQTVHVAREMGIHYVAAGHHATEKYGVSCFGAHLAEKFELRHQFIDIDCPV
ncbi:GTP cyclohydrolase 1 type 2 homolog YbgI [hydrothermal vent metagenome]|uniref:GTP cyclohydrolase 1 type 2 homolog YbgI n=1 Tax=hydrothermal vent metagenome TaxID=652676 RepID=A0A3B1A507_9ZZZZ